jgi:hypothetical protein
MVAANIEFEEACKVLGLDIRHASANSINKAYRALAKKYHPDKNPGVDPGIFVRITEAKNTALKHVKNSVRDSSPPAKPLKLEIVPSETEFKNVGRRETKSREFIIYSTGGPFTRFAIDRKHLPKWIHISSVTRTTNEELPVRVTIRVTGPELGDRHECHIPVKIENKNTGCSEEIGVRIKLSMKAPILQLSHKSVQFSADRHGPPGPQILTLINAGAGQIKGDLHSQEPWIVIEPAHVSFHDRQRVQIKVDAFKLADRNSGQVSVRTNAGEETITIQANLIPRGVRAPVHGRVNTINPPNGYQAPVHADIPFKDGNAQGRAVPDKISIAKSPGQPLQKRKTWGIVKVDSRKAALAVTAAAGGLFMFSIICIANASPQSFPSTTPLLQETAQIEQPGNLLDAYTVIPAPAVQPETPAVNETRNDTIQPKANDLISKDVVKRQPVVNQYWPRGYASSDNVVSNPTYSAIAPIITGESTGIQQNNPSSATSGKTDAKSGPVNQVKKKDGKIRRPLQYVDIESPRNRFNKFTNPGPPRLNRERDN